MSQSEAGPSARIASTAFSQSDLVIHALSSDLDRPVVTFNDTGQTITAREFREVISRFAQALTSIGLSEGARVGLISRNRPEVLFIHGAAALIDICIVPLHPMGSADDVTYMVDDAHIEVMIFDAGYYQDLVRDVQQRVPHLKHLLALGPTAIGEDLTERAARFSPQPLVPYHPAPEGIIRLGYSGGTTGKSKAITLSSRAFLATMDILLKEWEWPSVSRQLICSPLSHAGGVVFLPTLLQGGSMVVLPGFDPTAVLEAIQKHRITCMLVVPTMI